MSFDKNWEKLVYKNSLHVNNYPYDWVVSTTFQNISNFKNKSVLELGCGTGNNLKFFNDLNFNKIVGIEGSETAIKLARKIINNKFVKLINKDFTKINLGNNIYDLIVDRGSITHNPKKNLSLLLNRIEKSLKKDGVFMSALFSSKHYGNFSKVENRSFKNEIKSHVGLKSSFFSHREIKKYFKKFKIISLQLDEKKNIFPNKKKISWWLIVVKK